MQKKKKKKNEDANHKDGREKKRREKIVSSKHKNLYTNNVTKHDRERKENNHKYIHSHTTDNDVEEKGRKALCSIHVLKIMRRKKKQYAQQNMNTLAKDSFNTNFL
jgi:hypothetical protein